MTTEQYCQKATGKLVLCAVGERSAMTSRVCKALLLFAVLNNARLETVVGVRAGSLSHTARIAKITAVQSHLF